MGDTNLHLSCLVVHVEGCRCSHCAPSRQDVVVENLWESVGLRAHNGPAPTHDSGTILVIDLFAGHVGGGVTCGSTPGQNCAIRT